MRTSMRPIQAGASPSPVALGQLELHYRGAKLDLVSWLDDGRARHHPAIHARAIGRAEVGEHPRAPARPQFGVAAGYVRIIDHDVALAAASQGHPASAQRHALTLD